MFNELLEEKATRCSSWRRIDRKDVCNRCVVVRLCNTGEDIPAIDGINDFRGGINDKVGIK